MRRYRRFGKFSAPRMARRQRERGILGSSRNMADNLFVCLLFFCAILRLDFREKAHGMWLDRRWGARSDDETSVAGLTKFVKMIPSAFSSRHARSRWLNSCAAQIPPASATILPGIPKFCPIFSRGVLPLKGTPLPPAAPLRCQQICEQYVHTCATRCPASKATDPLACFWVLTAGETGGGPWESCP